MIVRNATYRDAPAIKELLEQLGYTTRTSLLLQQLEIVFNKIDHCVYVYELNKEVIGFVSVHFLPQLGLETGLTFISYFSLDKSINNLNIGIELEQYITRQARINKCERIQVPCLDWRTPDHQFYIQQGYQEYPKYFTKIIS